MKAYNTRPGVVMMVALTGVIYYGAKYLWGVAPMEWEPIIVATFWSAAALAVHWWWGKP